MFRKNRVTNVNAADVDANQHLSGGCIMGIFSLITAGISTRRGIYGTMPNLKGLPEAGTNIRGRQKVRRPMLAGTEISPGHGINLPPSDPLSQRRQERAVSSTVSDVAYDHARTLSAAAGVSTFRAPVRDKNTPESVWVLGSALVRL
jgi:hypothetical protein